MPFSSYLAVVCSEGASLSSQPYSSTASVMSASRPWLASRPAVALPLLYSMTSGASLELSTWLAVERICSKLLSSNSTVAPVSSSKISMAFGPGDADIAVGALEVPELQGVRVGLGSVGAAGEQCGRGRECHAGDDAALGDSHGAFPFESTRRSASTTNAMLGCWDGWGEEWWDSACQRPGRATDPRSW